MSNPKLALSLFMNSDDFKKTYGQFDIAGGFFNGTENGAQSANTNIIFDVYNKTDDGGGVTKFEIQNSNGDWQQKKDIKDPSTISQDSKARITFFVNPKQLGNDKVKIADTYNHEANVHGTPFLKTLDVLRNKGGSEFMKEWKYSSSSATNRANIPSRYNGTYGHAEAALGLNANYNNTGAQIRNQLAPAEKKRYDAIIRNNPNFYREDIINYNKVPR